MHYFGPGDLDSIEDLDDWRERVTANLREIALMLADLDSRLDDLASEVEELRTAIRVRDNESPPG